MNNIAISAVKIGERIRKELGELDSLAESIAERGLLHPIAVTPDLQLIAGYRRIEAAKLLGWTEIPHNVIDIDDIILGERDENEQRKDFTPSEAVAVGRLIEKRERPKAEERRRTAVKGLPPVAKGERRGIPLLNRRGDAGLTVTKAAHAVGYGTNRYLQAKAIVEAAEEDPKHSDLVEEMDREKVVQPVFEKLEARKNGRPEPAQKLTRKPVTSDSYLKGLASLRGTVDAITATELPTMDAESRDEAENQLTYAIRALGKVRQRVKGQGHGET